MSSKEPRTLLEMISAGEVEEAFDIGIEVIPETWEPSGRFTVVTEV